MKVNNKLRDVEWLIKVDADKWFKGEKIDNTLKGKLKEIRAGVTLDNFIYSMKKVKIFTSKVSKGNVDFSQSIYSVINKQINKQENKEVVSQKIPKSLAKIKQKVQVKVDSGIKDKIKSYHTAEEAILLKSGNKTITQDSLTRIGEKIDEMLNKLNCTILDVLNLKQLPIDNNKVKRKIHEVIDKRLEYGEFALDLTIETIFKNSTVKEVADFISQKDSITQRISNLLESKVVSLKKSVDEIEFKSQINDIKHIEFISDDIKDQVLSIIHKYESKIIGESECSESGERKISEDTIQEAKITRPSFSESLKDPQWIKSYVLWLVKDFGTEKKRVDSIIKSFNVLEQQLSPQTFGETLYDLSQLMLSSQHTDFWKKIDQSVSQYLSETKDKLEKGVKDKVGGNSSSSLVKPNTETQKVNVRPKIIPIEHVASPIAIQNVNAPASVNKVEIVAQPPIERPSMEQKETAQPQTNFRSTVAQFFSRAWTWIKSIFK